MLGFVSTTSLALVLFFITCPYITPPTHKLQPSILPEADAGFEPKRPGNFDIRKSGYDSTDCVSMLWQHLKLCQVYLIS